MISSLRQEKKLRQTYALSQPILKINLWKNCSDSSNALSAAKIPKSEEASTEKKCGAGFGDNC